MTPKPNRFWNAYMIQQGACNPSGIARSLVEAIDEQRAENSSTKATCNDPAVRMIAHQLAHVLRLAEYDQNDLAWNKDYRFCEQHARPEVEK